MIKDDRAPTESQMSPEQKAQLQALNKAYVEYADRIQQWTKANGNTPPPIYWDANKQQFLWMNREQRRRSGFSNR